jgi:hypothetical protein
MTDETVVTGPGGHRWEDYGDTQDQAAGGQDQKRCSGCFTVAVRRWRSNGKTYGLSFFAPGGTQVPAPLPCAEAMTRRAARTGRRELFWVYLELTGGGLAEGLAGAVTEEYLTGWRVHRDPPFVSVRIIADSMPAAQDVARAMVSEISCRAGLGEPALGEVIAIPAGVPPQRIPAVWALAQWSNDRGPATPVVARTPEEFRRRFPHPAADARTVVVARDFATQLVRDLEVAR